MTGRVENLQPWFDRCRLSVAPLRYGAGIKGKVVMSLKHGVPCVATPVAVEGMELPDGQGAVVAEDEAAFVRAVVELYTNPQHWQTVAVRGLNFVRENYSREMTRQRVKPSWTSRPNGQWSRALIRAGPPGTIILRSLPLRKLRAKKINCSTATTHQFAVST